MHLEEILTGRWDIIERIDHDHWWGWPVGGISLSWVGGMWAQVDGTHIINLITLAFLSIGSAGLGLWRLYESGEARKWKRRQLDDIEIEEAKRASLARIPITQIIATPVLPEDIKP